MTDTTWGSLVNIPAIVLRTASVRATFVEFVCHKGTFIRSPELS